MVIWARLSTWNTPKRIGAAQHRVDRGVLGRQRRHRERPAVVALDQREGLADAGQHAERQHVDLEDAERIEIVLVPLDEGALGHRGVEHRHDLIEPRAGQDEAADVLREMAREARELARELQRQAQARLGGVEAALPRELRIEAAVAPAPDAGGQAHRPRPRRARAPCRPRGSRCARGSGSPSRRCRRARGRTSGRCTGSPPRAARARSRRRCRAAPCARPRRSARTGGRSARGRPR